MRIGTVKDEVTNVMRELVRISIGAKCSAVKTVRSSNTPKRRQSTD
jgi:hypothetical protein